MIYLFGSRLYTSKIKIERTWTNPDTLGFGCRSIYFVLDKDKSQVSHGMPPPNSYSYNRVDFDNPLVTEHMKNHPELDWNANDTLNMFVNYNPNGYWFEAHRVCYLNVNLPPL